jgi:hypothetical protein
VAKSKKPEGKYNLTLSLDPDLARRFNAFCVFTGGSMSDVAARLFRREMKGFSISHRPSTEGPETQEDAEIDPDGPGTVRMPRDKKTREAG